MAFFRLSTLRLNAALFGAPLAWITQMLLSEMLSSHACYPGSMPAEAPSWRWLLPALAIISILCILAALASGWLAWKEWQATRPAPAFHTRAISRERRRFIAMLGLMTSGIFITATLFTASALLLVSPCSRWW